MTPRSRSTIWIPPRKSIPACSRSTLPTTPRRRAENHSCLRRFGRASSAARLPTSPIPMRLSLTTWNINSVRLRIDLVAKFLKAARPDVLCLQETKCPDDRFPLKRFRRLGYEHVALNGQKGYHGVWGLSRLPLDSIDARNYCGKSDSRQIAGKIG